jgi:hypothetical protein
MIDYISGAGRAPRQTLFGRNWARARWAKVAFRFAQCLLRRNTEILILPCARSLTA